MAPKITANAAKQALILAWFHKTAVAHSIKDLEKAIPSVASINGMQVKDYLQSLSDDNKIRVEKIGSGNWYWSFPNDDKKTKEDALKKAQEEYNKVAALVADLQAKVDEAGAAREEGEELLMGSGMSHHLTYVDCCSHGYRRRPGDTHIPTYKPDQGSREPSQRHCCLQ